MAAQPNVDPSALRPFREAHRIAKPSVLGSYLGNAFGDESDVDFLVEFDKDAKPSLLRLGSMEAELSSRIGRKADLRTRDDLSPYFGDEVVRSARLYYAA